jgi:pimeloyl-ACP methyl ester carboxylesterase
VIREKLKIKRIPALLWGERSDKAYIFVHGAMSCKEDAQMFAEAAVPRGYQVISFDLPEHGERKNDACPCDVQNGVKDLAAVGEYALQGFQDVSLFANSLGAYFSLLAYKSYPLKNCLFLSPVLDMERLIRNMMKGADVSEEMLMEKRKIQTPAGQTLDWDYYSFVKAHPVDQWNAPTAILYGSKEDLTEWDTVDRFVKSFHADLTVLDGGEHYFHTEEQLNFLRGWLKKHIPVSQA